MAHSGGKSSLIQALMLLKQSVTNSGDSTGLIPRGEYVDLGIFKSLLHKHDTSRHLHLGLDGSERVPAFILGGIRPGKEQWRQISTEFAAAKGRKGISKLVRVGYRLGESPELVVDLERGRGAASKHSRPAVQLDRRGLARLNGKMLSGTSTSHRSHRTSDGAESSVNSAPFESDPEYSYDCAQT